MEVQTECKEFVSLQSVKSASRVPLRCAMIYERGAGSTSESDYMAIPPQIADFAGTESRAEWHNLFLA